MTNMVTITDTKILLNRKLDHLQAILALTEKQSEFIDTDEIDALLDNIAQRQRHIDAIEVIQDELPERQFLLMDHGCAQLAVKINDSIAQTQKLDTINQQKARDRLAFLRGQMQKVSQGRRAGTGYDHTPSDLGATYFDSRK